MAKVKFNANCIAAYSGELELPDNIDPNNKGSVLRYILDNINDVPCNELRYVDDTEEPVTMEDIIEIL